MFARNASGGGQHAMRRCRVSDGVERAMPAQIVVQIAHGRTNMLLLLANFGQEGSPEPMIAKISQETLAQMIGTTRSQASFFMNRFRDLGFISYNGRIEIHSSLLNAVLHDKPHIKL